MNLLSSDTQNDALILTLDIGSSSARALIFDSQARTLPQLGAQEQYTLRSDSSGASEDDPDAALARVFRCIDGALTQLGSRAHQLRAVALTTLATTMVVLDKAGRPLTPLYTYADTRNAADAARLQADLDESASHQRCGCLLRTSYWPARLAWLRRTRPDIWARAARFATIGEYLEEQLFGQSRVSYAAASWSGMLNRHALSWDAHLCDQLGVAADQFAPLVDCDAPQQGLTTPFAQRWPALRSLPWFPAVGDGAAANVGSGCTGPAQVALTIGTTGALRVAGAVASPLPRSLWLYRIDRATTLLGGATSEGGNLYAWLRQSLRLGAAETLERELAAMPPDGHGLTVLPFIAGERSPGWAGAVRATIHGIGIDTRPAQLVQAALEAIGYRFALIAADLPPHPERQVIASGGALNSSPAWAQMLASILGQPVSFTAEAEATSRGVALLALRSLGLIDTLDALPASVGTRYDPIPAYHQTYQAAIERQRTLYERLVAGAPLLRNASQNR